MLRSKRKRYKTYLNPSSESPLPRTTRQRIKSVGDVPNVLSCDVTNSDPHNAIPETSVRSNLSSEPNTTLNDANHDFLRLGLGSCSDGEAISEETLYLDDTHYSDNVSLSSSLYESRL